MMFYNYSFVADFAPKLKKEIELTDVRVFEGEQTKLECKYKGKPNPFVLWKFNNASLARDDDR